LISWRQRWRKEIKMTTLQARNWAHFAKSADKPRDYSRLWAGVRTALGFALIVALLVAAFAVRVLVYVHL
jgi:hypothetical protein